MIRAGTVARRAYGKEETAEEFRCNYGLNSAYRGQFSRAALQVSGMDADDQVSIVELPGHRFYVGTLFLPQLSSSLEAPHPLVLAYLQAARE